jgi:Cof subfamily protein (haloacid dehalogenase superfamily)
MPIRLLAIDLDGTLLRSDRTPHPESAAALRKAVAEGVIVVLASGRIRTSMVPFAEEIGLRCPIVSCNGALVQNADGQVVAHWKLPTEVFDAVWPYTLEAGAHLNVYTASELLFLKESPFGQEYARRLKTIQPRVASVEEIRGIDISKILVMDHPERIVKHREILEGLVDSNLGRSTLSEPDYLEFLARDVSKGKALAALCAHLGIDRSETAAIGDYLNDKEMLEWVGMSGTVANGHRDLRSVCSVTVRSNDDGGVAEFVLDHVLKAVPA